MAHPLHASRLRTFGIHNLVGRNYDYTNIYRPDEPGEEAKENARVWNVYLDEAESHDADMIEGFRSIIESLLVFAALFSAVVTTFVVQTSQALQPDNAQIMVSLLFENNRLLRAAGNRTDIDAVARAPLGPGSRTYTSIDVWVNGLFFTSLALSLSTALLSVLAKQWIQAYTAIVPGGAKTRALIRQFRFDGLVKYKLGDIIETLPLILHCSVAIFLVGLVLYVSQLSRPISGIVAGITALTFLFYFGSSMIPALDIACPYRIPVVFYSTKLLLCALDSTAYICRNPWNILKYRVMPWRQWLPLRVPMGSLRMAEHNKVLEPSNFYTDHLAHNSFAWVFNHSSNYSVKQVVIEGTDGLLDGWTSHDPLPSKSLSGNSYLLSAIKYYISRLQETYSASSMEDAIGKNKYGRLIERFMWAFHLTTLLDEPTVGSQDWQEQIRAALFRAYEAALRDRHRVLSRWLLDLGGRNLFQCGSKWSAKFAYSCAYDGDAEDFRGLIHRGIDLDCRDSHDLTALHHAAGAGNLDVAIALVEREPALVNARTRFRSTALDIAILNLYNSHTNRNSDDSHTMVTYLLDHGAQSSSRDALDYALKYFADDADPEKVKLLLDCECDRTDTQWQE